MTRFPHSATRIFGVSLAIHSEKASIILRALSEARGIALLDDEHGMTVPRTRGPFSRASAAMRRRKPVKAAS